MSHVAWSVCLCWLHRCTVQKRLNRSRCRMGANFCGSKEPCIRWGQDQINLFAAVRGTNRRCGLLTNYFGHLLLYCMHFIKFIFFSSLCINCISNWNCCTNLSWVSYLFFCSNTSHRIRFFLDKWIKTCPRRLFVPL